MRRRNPDTFNPDCAACRAARQRLKDIGIDIPSVSAGIGELDRRADAIAKQRDRAEERLRLAQVAHSREQRSTILARRLLVALAEAWAIEGSLSLLPGSLLPDSPESIKNRIMGILGAFLAEHLEAKQP